MSSHLLRSLFISDWTEEDKRKLLTAVKTYGRLNLRAIAAAVPSKNLVQVASYLEVLKLQALRHPCASTVYPEALEEDAKPPANSSSLVLDSGSVTAIAEVGVSDVELDPGRSLNLSVHSDEYTEVLYWRNIRKLYNVGESTAASATGEAASPLPDAVPRSTRARTFADIDLTERALVLSMERRLTTLVRLALLLRAERVRLASKILAQGADERLLRIDVATAMMLLGTKAPPAPVSARRRRAASTATATSASGVTAMEVDQSAAAVTGSASKRRRLSTPTPQQVIHRPFKRLRSATVTAVSASALPASSSSSSVEETTVSVRTSSGRHSGNVHVAPATVVPGRTSGRILDKPGSGTQYVKHAARHAATADRMADTSTTVSAVTTDAGARLAQPLSSSSSSSASASSAESSAQSAASSSDSEGEMDGKHSADVDRVTVPDDGVLLRRDIWQRLTSTAAKGARTMAALRACLDDNFGEQLAVAGPDVTRYVEQLVVKLATH